MPCLHALANVHRIWFPIFLDSIHKQSPVPHEHVFIMFHCTVFYSISNCIFYITSRLHSLGGWLVSPPVQTLIGQSMQLCRWRPTCRALNNSISTFFCHNFFSLHERKSERHALCLPFSVILFTIVSKIQFSLVSFFHIFSLFYVFFLIMFFNRLYSFHSSWLLHVWWRVCWTRWLK